MLIQLFIVFFRIGLFAVGGAYSFLPLLQKEVVASKAWLSEEEFLEILGMVKIFPGAISIKFATYTGYKMAGIPGAVVANLGNILAPAVLIFAATLIYTKLKGNIRFEGAFAMIQLAVFAMIIAVAFQTISVSSLLNLRSLAIITAVFILFMFTSIHPAVIIIGAGLLGAVFHP